MNSQKEINEKSLKIWKSIDTRIKLEEKGTVDKKKNFPKPKFHTRIYKPDPPKSLSEPLSELGVDPKTGRVTPCKETAAGNIREFTSSALLLQDRCQRISRPLLFLGETRTKVSGSLPPPGFATKGN